MSAPGARYLPATAKLARAGAERKSHTRSAAYGEIVDKAQRAAFQPTPVELPPRPWRVLPASRKSHATVIDANGHGVALQNARLLQLIVDIVNAI